MSGHVIVSLDFNQQELRLLASVSKDPVLIDAYNNGVKVKDLHTITGCAIAVSMARRSHEIKVSDLQLDGEKVDYDFFQAARNEDDAMGHFLSEARKVAKVANFLIVFGGGPMTLSKSLRVPREVAQEYIDGFFRTYKMVPKYWEDTINFARRHGYVATAYGTRRHCWPSIVSGDKRLRSAMERKVCNFLIQSCAADILKIVLKEAVQDRLFERTGAYLIAPIYDEITASVPKETLVDYVRDLSRLMAVTPPGHAVAMVPEVSIGLHNWGKKVELGSCPSPEQIQEVLEQPEVGPGTATEAVELSEDLEDLMEDVPWNTDT